MRIFAGVFLSLLLPQDPPAAKPVASFAESIDAEVSRISGFRGAEIAPACDDGEYLRRIMLDLLGYPPNAEELRAFVADPAARKRSAKVDELLATDRFSDFWARRWRDVLVGDTRRIATEPLKSADPDERERLMEGFRAWMQSRIARDLPWTDTVREILEAEGDAAVNPAVVYKLVHHEHPRVPGLEGQASRHFLGVNLSCTGCHDSAFDKWTVDDGYSMAAFSNGRKIFREKGVLTVAEGPEPAGRPIPGDRGAFQNWGGKPNVFKTRFLAGGAPREGEVLAKAFARLVVAPENLQFRKAAVNRIWAWLMGRGIVWPVEDFNLKNKPLSRDLLDVLAKSFASNGHSMKFLIRAICASAAYQRGCAGEQATMKIFWSRTPVRPLSAEQVLNSIEVATQGKPRFDLTAARRLSRRWISPELPSCETIAAQAEIEGLAWLSESEEVWSLIRGGAVLKAIREAGPDPAARTNAMFLAALSRAPSRPEADRYAAFLHLHREEGLVQAYWTLLQSTEFVTRH